MQKPILTLVMGFRDRELARLERCLGSLEQQSRRDFQLILVDYGSASGLAAQVRSLAERFAFCRHVSTDTRGQPWNRARALNVGVRMTASGFVLTTDVDMIFPPEFVAVTAARMAPERVLCCFPLYLPKGFDAWDRLAREAGRLEPGGRHNKGGCQCVATEVFHRLHGFDERFRYWGGEDHDLHDRLLAAGLEEHWLNDATAMFHQWHPSVDWHTPGLMPAGLWGRLETYRLAHREQLVRNPEGWGEIVPRAARRVYDFLDPETGRLRERPELVLFDRPPASNKETGNLVKAFWDLPSGHALAIDHAFFPHRRPGVDLLLRFANRALRLAGSRSRLDYAPNLLHGFLDAFLDEQRSRIADYYLGFPARSGVSVVVKA